uniref:Uncharacterized protein n=1 Tax=viral metagenome TaxID=1070528 RepID=A0A6M3KEX5_9ZZZZ
MDFEKRYYDLEGNQRNILEMVARDPGWAANRIQEGEKAIAELERLKASRSEALRISSEILEQAEQERLDAES